jgi:hypothetical protein
VRAHSHIPVPMRQSGPVPVVPVRASLPRRASGTPRSDVIPKTYWNLGTGERGPPTRASSVVTLYHCKIPACYVVEDIEADYCSPGSSNFFHNFSNYLVRSGIWWDCSGLGEVRKNAKNAHSSAKNRASCAAHVLPRSCRRIPGACILKVHMY